MLHLIIAMFSVKGIHCDVIVLFLFFDQKNIIFFFWFQLVDLLTIKSLRSKKLDAKIQSQKKNYRKSWLTYEFACMNHLTIIRHVWDFA